MYFQDESHFTSTNLCQRYAYGPVEFEIINTTQRLEDKRYTLLSTIGINGHIHSEIVDSSTTTVTKDVFENYLRHTCSQLPVGSVLVIDNAPVHLLDITVMNEIEEIYEIAILRQSPYSPDLNPIELVFSFLKTELKRFQWSHETFVGILSQVLQKVSAELCQAFIYHCSHSWIQNEIM